MGGSEEVEVDLDAAQAAYAAAVNGHAGTTAPAPALAEPARLTAEQGRAWVDDGWFVVRGLVDVERCEELNRLAVERVREVLATGVRFGSSAMGDGQLVIGESNFADRAPPEHPEDHASKLYNLHRSPGFRELAEDEAINGVVAGVLGPDVDCFNSQFIFKNPGAWGQPWHQDSLYFRFDRHPQVGVWLATSPATEANGCLWVRSGSHTDPLHVHVPDRRPGANLGYLEVVDVDEPDDAAVHPVELATGDVLVFHSFLLHRSGDNGSTARRTAVVLHYGEPGTTSVVADAPSATIDWMPTRRS